MSKHPVIEVKRFGLARDSNRKPHVFIEHVGEMPDMDIAGKSVRFNHRGHAYYAVAPSVASSSHFPGLGYTVISLNPDSDGCYLYQVSGGDHHEHDVSFDLEWQQGASVPLPDESPLFDIGWGLDPRKENA